MCAIGAPRSLLIADVTEECLTVFVGEGGLLSEFGNAGLG